MRLVERAVTRPMHCAVFPTLGAAHGKGYIDPGTELPGFDNHVYVSVEAVEQMAEFIGFPSREAHAAALARADDLERKVADLEADLREADKFAEAVDVLESRDFRARRKPGRPKKTMGEAA